MSVPDYFVPTDDSALVLPSDAYTVVSVQQTQEINGDKLTDWLDISFTVSGRVGVFSFQIPILNFNIFEQGIDLTGEAELVNALYAIPV